MSDYSHKKPPSCANNEEGFLFGDQMDLHSERDLLCRPKGLCSSHLPL